LVLGLLALLLFAGLGAGAARAAAPLNWLPTGPSDAPLRGFTALDCPSVSLCVSTDNGGGVLSTTTPLRGGWRTGAWIELLGRLDAISCPSAARCFVVGAVGNLDSGSTVRGAPAWTSWNIDPITPLDGISCPSASLCVAVDAAGHVLASTTPAAPLTWSLPMTVDSAHRLDAISCPTVRLCVAVDGAGNVLVSTDPTSMGAWRVTPLAPTGSLSSVSCTSAGLCVVGARDGSVYASAAVASPPVTWSATPIDSGRALSAVSCSDVGLCLALDQSGYAFESDNPASGRPVWVRAAIDRADGPSGASCRPVVYCVVVDSGGNALAGVLPGPSVMTGGATVASQTAAQISATVDPNDANVAGCQFDLGRTTAYGLRVPCSPMPRATGGSQAVGARLRGLTAATTYHFRIAANTGVGATTGADSVFITPAPLTASPSLVGSPAVGSLLTCDANIPAATTPTPPITASYAWLADTAPIAGATAATHLVSPADASHHLRCQVSLSGDGAITTATSGFDNIPAQTAVRIIETRVAAVTHGSTWVRVPVACSPLAARICTLTLRLTAMRRVNHRSRALTVGLTRATLAAGATRTLTAWLNDKGKRLLKRRHRLAVTLAIRGTVVGTLIATLRDETLVLAQGRRPTQHDRWGACPVRSTCS
jgi:hypothetical protein